MPCLETLASCRVMVLFSWMTRFVVSHIWSVATLRNSVATSFTRWMISFLSLVKMGGAEWAQASGTPFLCGVPEST